MKIYSIKLTLTVLVILAIFTTACNQAQKPDPKPEENKPPVEQKDPAKEDTYPKNNTKIKLADYFPLTLGSTWQYLGEGNEYASFSREVIFVEGNKAQFKEDNGGTVSASVFEITDKEITRVFFQGESYENTNFLNTEAKDSLVILKTPLQVGTKWDTAEGTREIVDLNATVDTPAGKFEKVLKIKITYPDSTMYEYFKDEVGMIKREFVSGDTKVTSTLEKYEIRKP